MTLVSRLRKRLANSMATGYGDYQPTTWRERLAMLAYIVIAYCISYAFVYVIRRVADVTALYCRQLYTQLRNKDEESRLPTGEEGVGGQKEAGYESGKRACAFSHDDALREAGYESGKRAWAFSPDDALREEDESISETPDDSDLEMDDQLVDDADNLVEMEARAEIEDELYEVHLGNEGNLPLPNQMASAPTIPLVVTLTVVLAYLVLGYLTFGVQEPMEMVYDCLVPLTTVGYGDYVFNPPHYCLLEQTESTYRIMVAVLYLAVAVILAWTAVRLIKEDLIHRYPGWADTLGLHMAEDEGDSDDELQQNMDDLEALPPQFVEKLQGGG